MPEVLVRVFDGTTTIELIRHEEYSYSVFGGPNECNIVGDRFGDVELHQIVRLSSIHVPILSDTWIYDLPLQYGMRYGGNDLTYQFNNSEITILDMGQDKPDDDFPYKNYPVLLPYAPLAVVKREKQTWYDFISELPNMPEEQPTDLVVVVPPPLTLGFSLWGHSGDGEYVTIVFECDLKMKMVKAYNICT